MQKYLLNMKMDVADEGYAVLLTVIDEDTYNKLRKSRVAANWGQIDDDPEYISFSELEDSMQRRYNSITRDIFISLMKMMKILILIKEQEK